MGADRSDIVTCPACGKRNRVPAAARGVPRCGACRSPLPWITAADDETFESVVAEARLPVLLDLWAPWCGPCRMVSPMVEELGREFAGRLKVVKVNVDEAPGVARRFNAMSIPTLVLARGGEERSRQVGAGSKERLRSWVMKELDAESPAAAGG
jgi:thioredoxin 2